MVDATLPLFLVDALPTSGRVQLDGAEARHAATVRRVRAGERVLLSDGSGSVARCVTDAVHAGRDAQVEVTIEHRWYEQPPALRVVIAQALVKGDRGELAVELATEAGVDAVLPWRAGRSVARWEEGERTEKALARWQNTAQSAAKQARRAHLPEVWRPVGTEDLADVVRDCARALVLDAAAEHGLRDTWLPTAGQLVLVVGPEGGIGPDELRVLSAAGAEPVRLGPSVLRASTAGAVALGALGACTERWA